VPPDHLDRRRPGGGEQGASHLEVGDDVREARHEGFGLGQVRGVQGDDQAVAASVGPASVPASGHVFSPA
jgi:TctA family transporter